MTTTRIETPSLVTRARSTGLVLVTVAVAAAAWLWAWSFMAFTLGWTALALSLTGVAVVAWLTWCVHGLLARRGSWLMVAPPAVAVAVLALCATDVPFSWRFEASLPALDHAVAVANAAGGSTGNSAYPGSCPASIGLYRIDTCTAVEGGYLYRDGSGWIGSPGVAHLGPRTNEADIASSSVVLTAIAGHPGWYRWADDI